MGLNKTLVLILSLSCLIIHTIAAAPSGGALRRRAGSPQMMVVNLCRNTTNSPLCVKTILPSIKAPFTQYKALAAEIEAVRDVALKTQGKIQTLLSDPKMSKDVKESLSICRSEFNNAVSATKLALVAVAARDALESRIQMSSVLSNLDSCKDSFTKGAISSPINGEASLLYDLGANCLDISKKIEDQQAARVLKRFGGKLPPPPPSAYNPKNDPCFGVIGVCSNL